MSKFIFLWKSGHIFHAIAPDKESAFALIPRELWGLIPFRYQEPYVVWHPATLRDYGNPNCQITVNSVRVGLG